MKQQTNPQSSTCHIISTELTGMHMCNSVHRHVLIHTDIHTDKFGDGSRFSNIKVTRADVLSELSGFLDLRLLPALVIQVFTGSWSVRQRQELQCCHSSVRQTSKPRLDLCPSVTISCQQ